jgi:hypothetical protein
LKESLPEALHAAFGIVMNSAEFLASTSCISLTEIDIANLEKNYLPKRFNNKLGVKVLSTVLYELLATPPYYRANKELYWKALLKSTKNYKG